MELNSFSCTTRLFLTTFHSIIVFFKRNIAKTSAYSGLTSRDTSEAGRSRRISTHILPFHPVPTEHERAEKQILFPVRIRFSKQISFAASSASCHCFISIGIPDDITWLLALLQFTSHTSISRPQIPQCRSVH